MSGSAFCWSTKQTCIKFHMCSYGVVYLLLYIYVYIYSIYTCSLSLFDVCNNTVVVVVVN